MEYGTYRENMGLPEKYGWPEGDMVSIFPWIDCHLEMTNRDKSRESQ